MRRRDSIILVGFGVAWPLAAHAQEPGRIYRLGSLFHGLRSDPTFMAFFEGMRQCDWWPSYRVWESIVARKKVTTL